VARSVGTNARADSTSASTWPITASTAALFRRAFDKLKMINEATNGAAGINQSQVMIQEFIL
jgi:hypothetical protein